VASMEERFWAKVQKSDTCWVWVAAKDGKGYGYFGSRKGETRLAHRLSWELTRGPIPAGLHIDHLCRNTSCVNPAHLEPVTPRENILRGIRRQPDDQCRRGHEFTPENTVPLAGSGRKTCRTCKRERERRAKAAKRAAERSAA